MQWQNTKRNKMLNKITLDKENRMLRFGFGKHAGTWFIRIDLWWIGIRLYKIC